MMNARLLASVVVGFVLVTMGVGCAAEADAPAPFASRQGSPKKSPTGATGGSSASADEGEVADELGFTIDDVRAARAHLAQSRGSVVAVIELAGARGYDKSGFEATLPRYADLDDRLATLETTMTSGQGKGLEPQGINDIPTMPPEEQADAYNKAAEANAAELQKQYANLQAQIQAQKEAEAAALLSAMLKAREEALQAVINNLRG